MSSLCYAWLLTTTQGTNKPEICIMIVKQDIFNGEKEPFLFILVLTLATGCHDLCNTSKW